jgi:hypothetical protein
MDPSHINVFLSILENREKDKWKHKYYPDAHYWKISYSGSQPPCTFHIELGSKLIYLHTDFIIQIWPGCHLAVYRYALRLNEEMSGAKIGLRQDGGLTFMVEWSREERSFASFETAVRTFLEYYRTYFPDIQLVAQDKDVAQQIILAEGRERAKEEDIANAIQVLDSETIAV